MTVSTSQVSAVIRTYLKNTKDKIEKVSNPSMNQDDVRDEEGKNESVGQRAVA